MRGRILGGMLLAFLSVNAMAGWDLVADLPTAQFYWDSKDVQKSAATVKVWTLTDFKEAQKNTENGSIFKSSKTRYEVDCANSTLRGLSHSQHKGGMAKGSVGFSVNTPNNWEPLPPNSVFAVIAKKACSPA